MDIKAGNWYWVKGCNPIGTVLYEGLAIAIGRTNKGDGGRFVRPGENSGRDFIVYKNKTYEGYPFDEIKPASKLHRYLFNGE